MCGKYNEGDFDFKSGWSYIVIINNASQIVRFQTFLLGLILHHSLKSLSKDFLIFFLFKLFFKVNHVAIFNEFFPYLNSYSEIPKVWEIKSLMNLFGGYI